MKRSLLRLAPIFAPRANNVLEIVLYKKQEPSKVKVVVLSFVAGFVMNLIVQKYVRKIFASPNPSRLIEDVMDQNDLDIIA